jgi:hypothetical protein
MITLYTIPLNDTPTKALILGSSNAAAMLSVCCAVLTAAEQHPRTSTCLPSCYTTIFSVRTLHTPWTGEIPPYQHMLLDRSPSIIGPHRRGARHWSRHQPRCTGPDRQPPSHRLSHHAHTSHHTSEATQAGIKGAPLQVQPSLGHVPLCSNCTCCGTAECRRPAPGKECLGCWSPGIKREPGAIYSMNSRATPRAMTTPRKPARATEPDRRHRWSPDWIASFKPARMVATLACRCSKHGGMNARRQVSRCVHSEL